MARRRFQPALKKNQSFTLNITSMTDMFTIMLVFLLQTFATSDVQILPEKDLRLPQSTTEKNPVEAARVIVTSESIKFGDKELLKLENQHVANADLDSKDDNFIPSLFKELDARAKASEKSEDKEGRLLLQADRSLPYSTLRKVLYTASMAGYPQLKMVTMVGN